MNLKNNPRVEDLKALFAQADDDDGHHVLWVDSTGNVHLSVVPENLTPVGFEDQTTNMKIRYETFIKGNGYVGEGAAADDQLMLNFFQSMLKEWDDPRQKERVKYVDS